MANFTLIGLIDGMKFLPSGGGCMLFLSEFKKGYKRSDGVLVDDKYLSWRCLFKQGMCDYISKHFSRGMLVEVKGEVYPYAVSHGEFVDGYSVLGQTLNVYSYPRRLLRTEQKMMKESQRGISDLPDLDGFNAPDFSD